MEFHECKRQAICFLSLMFVLLTVSLAIAQDDDSNENHRAWQKVLHKFTSADSRDSAYSSDLDKLNWLNPSPSVLDLGLDKAALAELTQDRIVLMKHPARTIEVPYYGEMVRWHNARFVSAVTKVPVEADKLRELIIKHDQQNGWKEVEPFVKETLVSYPEQDIATSEQVGLRYKIQAKISLIRVNGNFYARNRYEENGDITSLFLHGDIGISLGLVPIIPKAVLSPLTMANVRRWEFIALDDSSSLLVITDWAEVMDGSDLSKRMTQYDDEHGNKLGGISDEDLVGPFPGVAVNLYNFKQTVLKLANRDDLLQGKKLDKGETPDFVNQLNRKNLEKLLENGPVVFMHSKQTVNTEYGGFPLHFVTAAYPVNASFENLRRYSAQMNYYADYVPQMSKSEIVQGSFSIPDFEKAVKTQTIPAADLDFTLSLGKGVKFISSFDINYRMRYWWEKENRLAFEAISGEIETVHGAVEWLPAEQANKSLLFYTTASDLGPNPKFPLSLSQKIPGADVASGVMVSVMAAGRQGQWVEMKLLEENTKPE